MSKNRELKEQAVAEILEKVRGAQSITLVSYSGLTVEQVTNLRRQCREKGVQYCVLKNRLVKLALAEAGIEGVDDLLNGPNAFVFSMADPVSGPKVITEFIEKNKLQSLTVVGGVFEGKAADVATIQALAKMPSRDEMLAMLVGSLQSPMAGLVAVLEQIAEQKEAA
ncbi:MAG: 50S ribosomal protein L10 [Clostridia bacterium]|nr:50S ribosomal protein L10 [Clostridia bacterium]